MADAVSEIERRFADLVARRFDENKLKRWYLSRVEDPSWSYILPLLKGNMILDFGCGLGFDCVIFAKKGYHVVGIDISPVSIEKAKQFAKIMEVADKISFQVEDVNSVKLASRFDIVFGRAILHHLTDHAITETGKLIKSLLKERGRAIFVEPLDKNPIVNVNRRFLDPYDRTPTEKPLNLKETIDAFEAIFKSVDHKELHLLSPTAYFFRKIINCPSAFKITKEVLERTDEFLLKKVPIFGKFAWITIMWCQ